MMDEAHARRLAEATLTLDDGIALGPARELETGWFFGWSIRAEPGHEALMAGSSGVIVNKRTGRLLGLGSAFPVERDFAMYDRGYQFEVYDLVIRAVRDLGATRRVVGELPLQIVEATYHRGRVRRIRRPWTDLERWKHLDALPCVFPMVHLYFHLELLEAARHEGWFEFEALEYRPNRLERAVFDPYSPRG
jgi:hypothetical protein